MKKWQLVGTTVLGASVLLGACGGNDGGSGDGKDLKGSAKGEGSSTVAPIVEKLNEKYPDFNQEKIVVHFTPLHRDPYYIKDGQIIINFFMIYFDENDQAVIDGQNIKDYVFDRLCELAEA